MDTKGCRTYLSVILSICFCFGIAFGMVNTVKSPELYASSNDNSVTTHFIYVGQGDASLIILPDGRTMLIDAGSRANQDDLIRYIKNLKIDTIDIFLVTHADSDHCGGASAILQNFKVNYVFRPFTIAQSLANTTFKDDLLNWGFSEDEILTVNNEDYADFISSAYSYAGAVYTVSNKTVESCLFSQNEDIYSIKFLYPFAVEDGAFKTTKTSGYKVDYSSESNDLSAVVAIDYNNSAILFMGDADTTVEKQLLNESQNNSTLATILSNTKILKVAHHGSNDATSAEFLNAILPNYAVISCGKNNVYGHPNLDVLTRLNNYCGEERVFVTKDSGSVIVSINNVGLVDVKIVTNDPVKINSVILYVFIVLTILVILTIIIYSKKTEKDKKSKISTL